MTCLTGRKVLTSREDAWRLIVWLEGEGKISVGEREPWRCSFELDGVHWHIRRPKRR